LSRFTDFLVNEVLPNGEVLHLKDIGRPVEDADVEPANGDNDKAQSNPLAADHVVAPSTSGAPEASDDSEPLPETLANLASHRAWSTVKAQTLRKHFSDETVVSLHALLVEGKNPPPKPDAGWGSRKPKEVVDPEETAMNVDSADKADSAGTDEAGPSESSLGGRGRGQGRDRGRGRGRGGRGGRGGGRQQDGDKWWTSYEDEREVVSQVRALCNFNCEYEC
jgi:tRNA pseudouridine13 synthase